MVFNRLNKFRTPRIFKRGSSNAGSDEDAEVSIVDESQPPPAYDIAMAEAQEKREKDMTFKESRTADLRLIWYSLGFSGTIIMEGYGLALITYLFSFAIFKERYGEFDEGAQVYEVRKRPTPTACLPVNMTSCHTNGASFCPWWLSSARSSAS